MRFLKRLSEMVSITIPQQIRKVLAIFPLLQIKALNAYF